LSRRHPCSTTAEPGVVAKGMTASGTLLGTWRANEETKYATAQVSLRRCPWAASSLAQGMEEGRDSGNLLQPDFLHDAAQSRKRVAPVESVQRFSGNKSQGWKSRKLPRKRIPLVSVSPKPIPQGAFRRLAAAATAQTQKYYRSSTLRISYFQSFMFWPQDFGFFLKNTFWIVDY
jgi:hypothetical protein